MRGAHGAYFSLRSLTCLWFSLFSSPIGASLFRISRFLGGLMLAKDIMRKRVITVTPPDGIPEDPIL